RAAITSPILPHPIAKMALHESSENDLG
ncbi:hypothetical protein D049_1770B, partial [Vibrio parahaemolyticus VPTS-2010]